MIRIAGEIFAIAQREIIRGIRDKSRLFGSLGRPFVWLFLLGTGLRRIAVSTLPAGISDYQHYIFPGMILMNVLFASMIAGTSLIWDREFGFLKEILVAPVSRTSIALGKMLGGATLAVIQGLLVLLFVPFLGIPFEPIRLLTVIPALFLTAFAITSLGMLIAVRMRSFQGFGIMNNFVVMPMFFLSGAMYSVEHVPEWLKVVIMCNPMNYAVDLVRALFLGVPFTYNPLLDIAVLAVFGIVLQSAVVFLFQTESE